MLQQIRQIKLAGALQLDQGAAMRAADLERGLGAAAKSRVIRAVPDHLHETGEVRQIVRQRGAGEDLRQVDLVALRQAEVLDEVAPARIRRSVP